MVLELVQVLSTRLDGAVRGLLAQLRGLGATGNNNAAEPFDDMDVLTPLGFDSRPVITDNTEAVLYREGQDGYVLAIVDKGRSRLTDLEEGETRLSGALEVSAVVRIRRSGRIEVTAKAGQDVVVNGGTLRVARVTDAVNVCTIAAQAGPYPAAITVTPINADGTPGAPIVGAPGAQVTISGKISSISGNGADHFFG